MDALRDTLSNYIPWLLALHILAVIAWMCGMLYLPRLFVYHTEAAPGSDSSERFKVMERKLLKGIMNPAMIAVWILGPLLAWLTGSYLDTWLHIKFALVVIMSVAHMMDARFVKDFAADRNTHTARYYRIFNEVPAVLMVAIVILVTVQPFGG
jgi:putative membrane protein